MNLVFLLEEQSAKEMLSGLLPKILPKEITPYFIVFEGKSDLEKRLVLKMKGWKLPDSKFVVLRDKDSGNCLAIKEHLRRKCNDAGQHDALIRIACHELESWYLGDLRAVKNGLKISISASQESAKFRDPDQLANASEELEKLTHGKYQKVGGSRAIGPLLNIDDNRSISFNHFVSGVRRMVFH